MRVVKSPFVTIPAQLGNLRVVLVATRNPLNIGAAARAMSNFGFCHLRVVNPYEPAYREARSAVGASDLLASAEEYGTIAEAVADCTLVVGTTAVRNRNLQQPVRRLDSGGILIRKRLGSSRVALLFGSERVGLSNEDLSHCHWLVRIPTCEQNISMNLGQAVAVCLYELMRDPRSKLPEEKGVRATAGDLETITGLLVHALGASGYPGTVVSTKQKVRRAIRRLNLSSVDAEVWLGMLRQIVWKLGAGARH
ncbi:MAG: RNA methyltransferase [Candidatus Acidiferrales bacterium]